MRSKRTQHGRLGLLALLLLASGCGHSSSAPTAAPAPTPTSPPFVPGRLGVTVLTSTGPRTVTGKSSVITFHLRVRGLHLDASAMGRRPAPGRGHLQVYLDRIPADAYTSVDLKGVVANVATPLFSVGFPPQVLKQKPGPHRLLVAPARNDYILYRVKPAVIHITFR